MSYLSFCTRVFYFSSYNEVFAVTLIFSLNLRLEIFVFIIFFLVFLIYFPLRLEDFSLINQISFFFQFLTGLRGFSSTQKTVYIFDKRAFFTYSIFTHFLELAYKKKSNGNLMEYKNLSRYFFNHRPNIILLNSFYCIDLLYSLYQRYNLFHD